MGEHTTTVTDDNFQSAVIDAGKPALVDFWAVWCGPCRTLGPIVDEVAADYGDKIVVGKLDVDSNRNTAIKYGIQAVPTMLLFKDGELVDRIVGVADKATISAKLDALL